MKPTIPRQITLLFFATHCFWLSVCQLSKADVFRWNDGELIPRTEGINLGPNVQLDGRELIYADLRSVDLTGANFQQSNLTNASMEHSRFVFANLSGSNLTNASLEFSTMVDANLTDANLTGARVGGTHFFASAEKGFTKDLLYSTASYQDGRLQEIHLSGDTTAWDLSGQDLSNAELDGKLMDANLTNANLSNASLSHSTLTRTNLTDSIITGADFLNAFDFTKEQLYSTTSYQTNNLRGVRLAGNDLTGWSFSGQDLTAARFGTINGFIVPATLIDADFTGAVVAGADFGRTTSTGFTKEQLYSTTSYQTNNLQGIRLGRNDFTGWDFSNQNLTNAYLGGTKLNGTNLSGVQGLNLAIFDSDTKYDQWTLFPDGFEPTEMLLTFIKSPAGDFDANDILDAVDFEMLNEVISDVASPEWLLPMFDVNSDSTVDENDRRIWIKDLRHTWFGDANLDGEFNSGDLVAVFQSGQYEDAFDHNSDWATGDWNSDGDFTSSDLVVAFQDGGYEKGATAYAVPEPISSLIPLVGILVSVMCRRQQLERG